MRAIGNRVMRRSQDDSGVIAVVTAILVVVLLVFAAFAVDIGRWYVEGQRLQRTVDAASLAGAPYLPGDLTTARAEARKVIALNGYDASSSAVPDSAITIGDRPSRLKVTMSSTIPNAFATVIGFQYQSLTRTATADFAAATAMGSPCNVMGNDPDPLLPLNPACPTSPNFWDNIAGPDSPKRNGDRYTTRTCASPDSNCQGTDNLDYSGGAGVVGQSYYVYKITPRANMASMTVQLFDPMFVDVGDWCQRSLGTAADGLWAGPDSPNPYISDAKRRYAWGFAKGTAGSANGQVSPTTASPNWSPKYCTGDNLFGGTASDINTSFLALNPTDTLDPMKATPVSGCAPKSYGGYSGDLTKALTQGAPGYDPVVAENFRRWVPLCTIASPQRNRDYYVLVRTNVPYGASATRMLDPRQDASTHGNGHNRYGLRVTVAGGSNSDVAVSALERMPIYAVLQGGTTTFHLARVSSANAGSTLKLTFYDTGESSLVSTIAIRNPAGNPPAGCRATGEVQTSPTGDFNEATCTLSNVRDSLGYNGKIQRIEIPVPSTYSCNDADPSACWYRLEFTYPPGATVNDTTTWSASLEGDPVRLVQ